MLLFILTIITIVFILLRVRIVSQSQAYIIERFGSYKYTWNVGIKFLIPFSDKIIQKISLKEQVNDFTPQPVLTRDNIMIEIDSVLYFQIVEPKLYTYEIEKPISALENLTATTLRNIIGELELDNLLSSRETVNKKIKIVLDEAAKPWGIKINRMELKNIILPEDIKEALEKEMKAERKKRELIFLAEGEKKSRILKAEGEKISTILEAEAKMRELVLIAEAQKEALFIKAEGEAEYLIKIEKAKADAIKKLNSAEPSKEVLILKSIESFEKLSHTASKIIIPNEVSQLFSPKEILKEIKDK